MNKQKNIPHSFDLRGLKAGDTFLGCPKCWFRLEAGVAANPVCPQCRAKMLIYDVTPEDVSCFACGTAGATHEIREASPRAGHHLCDDCKQREERANRAMRDLSS